MDFNKQKNILKKLRADLESEDCELHVEFASDLIDQVNSLIGLINCYLTDDDVELGRLAVEDGLRGAE
jgi:hypothetical protein